MPPRIAHVHLVRALRDRNDDLERSDSIERLVPALGQPAFDRAVAIYNDKYGSALAIQTAANTSDLFGWAPWCSTVKRPDSVDTTCRVTRDRADRVSRIVAVADLERGMDASVPLPLTPTTRIELVRLPARADDRWSMRSDYVDLVWTELLGVTAVAVARRLGHLVAVSPPAQRYLRRARDRTPRRDLLSDVVPRCGELAEPRSRPS